MSRRRQQRRIEKERRHLQPANEWSTPIRRPPAATAPARVVVREPSHVERLAYTRSQAAQALGISHSTLRRLLPYIETIELPWGTKLIPVDELQRLASERRRTPRPRLEPAMRGRKTAIAPEIAKRIRDERSSGRTLRQITDALNAERIPTAHGGEKWWPSTVRGILQSRSP